MKITFEINPKEYLLLYHLLCRRSNEMNYQADNSKNEDYVSFYRSESNIADKLKSKIQLSFLKRNRKAVKSTNSKSKQL